MKVKVFEDKDERVFFVMVNRQNDLNDVSKRIPEAKNLDQTKTAQKDNCHRGKEGPRRPHNVPHCLHLRRNLKFTKKFENLRFCKSVTNTGPMALCNHCNEFKA
uniref:Uncharacterized protein n=1 Tax=Cacopsylla melanoneura TaxID=428564 RepID=A0A8D8QW84_9HEMI